MEQPEMQNRRLDLMGRPKSGDTHQLMGTGPCLDHCDAQGHGFG